MNVLSVALDSIGRATAKVDKAAARIAKTAPVEPESQDTVDLSAEMLSLMKARTEFKSAIKVAQTGDEMTRATIDLLG